MCICRLVCGLHLMQSSTCILLLYCYIAVVVQCCTAWDAVLMAYFCVVAASYTNVGYCVMGSFVDTVACGLKAIGWCNLFIDVQGGLRVFSSLSCCMTISYLRSTSHVTCFALSALHRNASTLSIRGQQASAAMSSCRHKILCYKTLHLCFKTLHFPL